MRLLGLSVALLVCVSTAMAQTSPHGTLRIPCATCHTTDSWRMRTDAQFTHASTGFDLTGVHKSVDCASCHRGLVFAGTKSSCQSCHTDVHKGELGNTCVRCHSFQSWRITDMIQRHQQTRFPLVGNHAAADCRSCHTKSAGSQYIGTPTTCIGCHRTQYAQTVNPNHRTAGFSTECADCHRLNASSWGTGFDHQRTRFPLAGSHLAAACTACHKSSVFKSTPLDCALCHAADYQRTADPAHASAGFSTQCANCHDPSAWTSGRFDHAATAFPLTGRHVQQQCRQCHSDNVFKGRSTDCYVCHQASFAAAASPAHQAGGFPHQCVMCHTTAGWKPSSFTHDNTQFPLQGAHRSIVCAQCHVNNVYAGTPRSCIGCHQSTFTAAKNPNHVAGNFPTTCTSCHSMNGWTPASFDHVGTRFLLTGAHLSVACASCHTNNNYQLAYNNCYQCHQSKYAAVVDPNHAAAGFSHACEQCHTTTVWKPSTFSHSNTSFLLLGAHQAVACSKCHVNNIYAGTPRTCIGCHQSTFAAAKNPNHVAGNFSTTCTACHSMNGWTPASFDHVGTRFLLTGAHVSAACASCHTNSNYQLVYNDCYQCHQSKYVSAVDPNHAAAGFGHACDQCHTTSVWKPSTFSHANTRFPLQGAHLAVACNQCHLNGVFAGTSSACIDCHRTDFNTVTSPNHVSGGFSTLCTACHGMNGWKPATFDHSTTKFALTGRHISAACQACHVGGNYQLTYQNCVQCHLTNYQSAVNPRHTGAAFNQQCETCHSTNGWSPATFANHSLTAFALTGAHVPAACASCHVSGNYKLVYTDCYACHQTKYAQPSMPNHVAATFAHACESCHTTTAWKPWTVNHDSRYMNIYSGRHLGRWGTDCTRCHTPTNYASYTCSGSGCHSKSSMDSNHNQVTGYSYSFPVCYNCHRFGSGTRI